MAILSPDRLLPAILVMLALRAVSQQSPMIDSLKSVLKTQRTDAAKAKTMALLTLEYANGGDSANTIRYANAAVSLYAKLKDAQGMGEATRWVGNMYFEKGSWVLADEKFNEALVFLEKDTTRKSKILQSVLLMNCAVLADKMERNEKSMQLLFKAVLIQESCQAYGSLKATYRNMAIMFEHSGERGRAGNYHKKSLEAAIQSKDDPLIFDAYLENAAFMINKGDFSKADDYLEAAKRSSHLPAENPLWGQYFLLKANTYNQKKDYEKALGCFNQAQTLIESDNTMAILNILLGRAEMHKAQGNYAKALEDVKKVHRVAAKDTGNVDMSARIYILSALIELSEKTGNMNNAYGYLQQKLALDRRANTHKISLQLRELDMKYQATKKDKDLLMLQNNNKKQEIRIQENKTLNVVLFWGICILAFSTALLYVLLYNRKKLAEKKEIIYRQKIEGLKKEQELVSYAAILEGQEQERLRLARDLHDGLNGMLSGIVMQLSAVKNNSSGNREEKTLHLVRIIGRINEAVSEVRSIAHHLMPMKLTKLGLDASLRDLCNTLRSEHTNIVYRSYDLSETIPQRKQITIYRMVQELVANAVRHAGAKLILVECLQDGAMLNVTVEDDGKGFDVQLPEHKKGTGMDTIEKQIGFLKGNITIQSLIGTGTTVHIQCLIHE